MSLNGRQALTQVLGQPRVTLTLYDQLALLTRHGNNRKTTHAIDPNDLTEALNTMTLNSGFIPPDVVWIHKRNTTLTIASYRPPQITGIWLEGVDYALHVPLPGLLLIHNTNNRASSLFAVASPPTNGDTPLFAAPLPNTGTDYGLVCWGSVSIPDASNDLAPVWSTLLGSAFVNHGVANKSQKHPGDIRDLLVELHEQKATEYPHDDLIPAAAKTLAKAMATL